MIVRTLITLGVVLPALTITSAATSPPSQPTLPDVLKKAIAYYATLTSYADSGTLALDSSGTITESRFSTHFRRPTRDLTIDFQTLGSTTLSTKFKLDLSAYRIVLWMFNNAMQKYDYKTRTHEIIDAENGGQVRALHGTSYSTSGASIMITSLLYSQARLPSAILQIQEAELAGVELVNQRRCHKVTGTAWAYYPSGQRTGIRPVTVWIDAETQLIRRVLEDTPKGYGGGQAVLRYTFNYEPQANPAIDDSKFQFRVPAQ